ncbi:hypothetical protein [Sunxiuqinia indica]|uniref:hypothetical protein n=1 Tax=Sunxiuqinia indica TaxID=2692584 RepID=UPI00135A9F66|nr:hypothetical protein [Sunxiuqinia indica]
MNTSETVNKKQKQVTPEFKDVSRFTRFISRMDDKDKLLEPKKRKQKWIIVLSFLFLFYLASFLLPAPELSHAKLDPQGPALQADTTLPGTSTSEKQKSLTFEMPVDSFENLLKKRIHESDPETK